MIVRKRRVVPVLAAVGVIAALVGDPSSPAEGTAGTRIAPSHPNVLVIITDDQASSMFNPSVMPRVFSDIVGQGVNFSRGYVESSLCCPSRAEILTGLAEHHTGVDSNAVVLSHPTIVEAAKDQGYRTLLAGKYLNSHPCSETLPEFDTWVCQENIRMTNPKLWVDGNPGTLLGYTVDVLADFVRDFVAATPPDQPFLAVYSPMSPHAPMDDDRFLDLAVPPHRPPSFDEETRFGTKPFSDYRPPLSVDEIASLDEDFSRFSRATRGVDQAVGSILDSLGERAADTLVVFVDDNGMQFGEHRRSAKRHQYEESVRVPFAARYPAIHPPDQPVTSEALVENIDIAPTIADAMGVPWVGDGVSLLPLIRGDVTSVRDALLIERCQGLANVGCGIEPEYKLAPDSEDIRQAVAGFVTPPFTGIVTPQWKLVDLATGEREVYDLVNDPYELDNRAGDPLIGTTEAGLAAQLAMLRGEPPTDTMIVSGPPAEGTDRVVRFRYSARTRDATFLCRLTADGVAADWYGCGAMAERVGPLADGDYVFEVVGEVQGEVDPTPASRSFSVHNTGPAVRIDGAPPARTAASALHFSMAADDPVDRFECRLAEAEAAGVWGSCSPEAGFDATVGDGVWEFEVRGVSGATVTSPPAAALVEVDTRGPATEFDPHSGSSVASADLTVSVMPDEPVDGPVLCTVDGGPQQDCSSGVLSLTGLAEGSHTVTARAVDTLGNTANREATFTVDLTPPTVSVLGIPPAVTNSIPVFAFTSRDEAVTYRCWVDGTPRFICASRDPMPGFGAEEGPHELSVQAIDAAGNASEVQTFRWTRDTTPPAVIVAGLPSGLVPASSVSVSLLSEAGVAFGCTLDGVALPTCGDSSVVGPFPPGPHAFSVVGTDGAGNASSPLVTSFFSDPNGFTTRVDSVGPNGLPLDASSARPAVSPDGTVVAYQTTDSQSDAATVSVRTRSSGAVTVLAADAAPGTAVAMSSDGELVAFTALGGAATTEVVLIDRAAGSETVLASPAAEPSLSGDGNVIAYTATDGTTRAEVLDRSSGQGLTVSSPGVPAGAPAVSGDGRWVAFVEGGAVRLADLSGGPTIDLSEASPPASGPSLDESGQVIAWEAGGNVVVLDRGADSQVIVGVGHDPVVSASGRFVAFTGDVAPLSQVFLFDRSLGWVRPVSIDAAGALGDGASGHPSVDASGAVVVFESSSPALTGTSSRQAMEHTWHPIEAAVPAPPTGVIAAAGDTTALVQWDAPEAGVPVVRYDVVAEPGGATASVAGDATAATVPGLTNGVAYTFTVIAVGEVASSSSSTSNAVTPLSVIDVTDMSCLEPDTGSRPCSVGVGLSNPSAASVTVDWRVVAGTATSRDEFTSSGTTTIPAGALSATVAVRVKGDIEKELNETCTLQLSGATGASLGRSDGTVTIVDNDPDPVASIGDASIVEGNTGTTRVSLRVTLSARTYLPVSLSLTAVPGLARAGIDFIRRAPVVNLPPGAVTTSTWFEVIGDTAVEGDETFSVLFRSATNALAGRTAIVTILDDDAARAGAGIAPIFRS